MCVFAILLMTPPSEDIKTEAILYIDAYKDLAIAEMH